MPSIVAKTMFGICAILLAGTFAFLYFGSQPKAGAQQVVAQFENAFPLIEGMHVRVDSAIAGSVGPIEVSDEGFAEVTLLLDDAIEPAMADASAAIRQQDTTGDSYVSFEPGAAKEPLAEVDGEPTITCDPDADANRCPSTSVAPRFDDLLNAFGPSQRDGVKLLLVELSKALEERGTDVNRATLTLRPALEATNQALAEVNSQNAALRSLIGDAEAVTGQAADKRVELGRLINGLAATVSATASEANALDAGLERLPETTRRAQTTLAALRRAATGARPLAEELRAGAPGLADLLAKTPSFLDDTTAVIDRTTPTLNLTRELLKAGTPTIVADPKRVVTGAFDLAPAISNLLTGVLGDNNTIKALFGDDSFVGFEEQGDPDGDGTPGTLDGYGLGAVAVEPGNQAGYPAEHEDRHFLRISAVLNCEMFGVPVEPGCLTGVLGAARQANARKGQTEARGGAQRKPSIDEPGGSSIVPPIDVPGVGSVDLNDLIDPDRLGKGIDDIRKSLDDLGKGLGGRKEGAPPEAGQGLNDLLDFLLEN